MRPLIPILIPAYFVQAWISQTLRSTVNQNHHPLNVAATSKLIMWIGSTGVAQEYCLHSAKTNVGFKDEAITHSQRGKAAWN